MKKIIENIKHWWKEAIYLRSILCGLCASVVLISGIIVMARPKNTLIEIGVVNERYQVIYLEKSILFGTHAEYEYFNSLEGVEKFMKLNEIEE